MSLANPSSPVTPSGVQQFETAEQWHHYLGDIPLARIVFTPRPGTATEQDLLQFVERDGRLVELIDGTLVEKPVGSLESLIAMRIAYLLNSFVIPRKLGAILGPDATLRMRGGRIRLPDVSFIGKEDFPGGKFPKEPVPMLPPKLAVEVISLTNTVAEMRQKIKEYFESGAKLVWLVYPIEHKVAVYWSASDDPTEVVRDGEILTGGDALPGFSVSLDELFKSDFE